MDVFLTDAILRQILLLDNLSDEQSTKHKLFPDHSNYNYFLTGPKRSGKTSLMFEYAFQAVENGMNVLFITRDKIDNLPHLVNQRQQPAMKILKSIEIIYPASLNEFLQIMSTMHLASKKYGLVLLDDIDKFYGMDKKTEMMVISKMLAFTIDAVAFLRKLGHSTFLIVSSSSSTQSMHRNIVETWIENFINIYPHHSGTGFVIKTETNNVKPNDDIVLKELNATFKEGRVFLHV